MVQTGVPYVLPKERKDIAAKVSVSCNDAAAVLSGAAASAAYVGFLTEGVGFGVSFVLGAYSASFWLAANAYQRLANDPPNPDYLLVNIPIAPVIPPFRRFSGEPEEVVIQAAEDLALLQNETEQAVKDSVGAIERVQGAERAFWGTLAPTRAVFNAVNSQRHSARSNLKIAIEVISAQERPREAVYTGVPKLLAGRPKKPLKITTKRYLALVERTDELRRLNGLSSVKFPARARPWGILD